MSTSIHFSTLLIMTGCLVFAIGACKDADENNKSSSEGHAFDRSQPKEIEEPEKEEPSAPRVGSTIRSEEERQLTFSPENDEDLSVVLAQDGKYYAAFISARHGVVGLRFAEFVTSPDARLASGRWSGATGRAFHPQDSYERFQSCCYISSPFPKLAWHNVHDLRHLPLGRGGDSAGPSCEWSECPPKARASRMGERVGRFPRRRQCRSPTSLGIVDTCDQRNIACALRTRPP